MITKTRHTGIVVRDLEVSIQFYRDLLGFKPVARMKEDGPVIEKIVGIDGVSLEWIKLKAPDGFLIELLQYHSHPDESLFLTPSNRLGCSHVAFTVRNLNEAFEVISAKGLHCVNPPQISSDGKVKVMYCHDPDGSLIELVEEL